MPDTKPGITFDEKGVCNACRNAEVVEKMDWEAQAFALENLAQAAFTKKPVGYNCLLPVSGGKDSTFMAFKARELGLNPLLVYVQPAYVTERGKRNLQNLVDHGFDCYVFHPNRKILPELLRRSFVSGPTSSCSAPCPCKWH
jgi:tRNA(Ile)-lysidine synthase TilS/MesJ